MEPSDPGADRGIVPEEDWSGKPGNPRIRLEVIGLLDWRSISALAVLQVEVEDGLPLVSLGYDLEKAMFSFPDKDSILVVDLVRIPGGNNESLLGKIGDEDAFSPQDEAVVSSERAARSNWAWGPSSNR